MSHRTTIEEDEENGVSSSSLLPTNQRTTQAQLVTRIYYPDTLYPDNYSFFADRPETAATQVKASLPMDPTHQYATAESASPPVIVSPLTRQGTTEIEIIDRPNKYVVSQTGLVCWFFLISFFIFSLDEYLR